MIGHSERELVKRLYTRHARLMEKLEGEQAGYWNREDVEHDADMVLALIALLERA